MNILENNELIIEVQNHGAELHKLYSKKHALDFLWEGDAKYWGRQAPVLFPIVGRLKNDETIIEGSTFSMSQHGFARDSEFTLTNKTENSLSFTLTANETTKKKFPYDFDLTITYTLEESNLHVNWKVTNTDDKTIYFSIGAHPAFNVPFTKGESLKNYYLTYNTRGNVQHYIFEPPYIKEKKPVEVLTKTFITPEMFSNDAIVYSNVDKVTIASTDKPMSISLDFKDFPFVGIWSPYYKETNSMAPFLCIEPWHGIADFIAGDMHFENKFGINVLEPKKVFTASYIISVN